MIARSVVISMLLLAAPLSGPSGAGTIVGGSVVEGVVPNPIIVAPTGPTQSTAIKIVNFDDARQPCLFALTGPLRDEYQDRGVRFSGPGALDGGAILDQCGYFAVTGYSGANFLAFNPWAQMANTGIPTGPERLTFPSDVVSVEMRVGGAGGGRARLEAFSAADVLLGSVESDLSPVLQVMSIAAPGIRHADISVSGLLVQYGWVVDDLSFDTGPTGAHALSWGDLKVIYR